MNKKIKIEGNFTLKEYQNCFEVTFNFKQLILKNGKKYTPEELKNEYRIISNADTFEKDLDVDECDAIDFALFNNSLTIAKEIVFDYSKSDLINWVEEAFWLIEPYIGNHTKEIESIAEAIYNLK